MASATITQKPPTMSQPQVIATGPPFWNAMKYEVKQPARIEMIVNEIAKFANPPIDRKSSWAYPSLCRSCSSSSARWPATGPCAVLIRLLPFDV